MLADAWIRTLRVAMHGVAALRVFGIQDVLVSVVVLQQSTPQQVRRSEKIKETALMTGAPWKRTGSGRVNAGGMAA